MMLSSKNYTESMFSEILGKWLPKHTSMTSFLSLFWSDSSTCILSKTYSWKMMGLPNTYKASIPEKIGQSMPARCQHQNIPAHRMLLPTGGLRSKGLRGDLPS